MDRRRSPICLMLSGDEMHRAEYRTESMHSGVLIRRAVQEEAAAIATVLRDSFAEFKALYTPGGFAATVLDPENVRLRLEEGPAWVAVLGGEIAGTASALGKGVS